MSRVAMPGSVAVIFEVEPHPERIDAYLQLAASLTPRLAMMDGFLENERFSSRVHPGRLVSLSLWNSETAAIGWRENALHRSAQEKGRAGLLKSYRIRVGETVDRHAPDGEWDEQGLVLLECREAASVVDQLAARGHETFVNLRDAGHALALVGADASNASGHPLLSEDTDSRTRMLRVKVLRDYGLTDRAQAPHA